MIRDLENEILKLDKRLEVTYNQKNYKKFIEIIETGLQNSQKFKAAISQLQNQDVQGCTCDNKLSEKLIEDGKVEFQSKNYELAAQKYTDSLIAGDINELEYLSKAYCNRGLCRLKMQQRPLDDFMCAINLNPNNDKAWYQLAVLLDKQGNYSEAKEAVQKCYNLQCKNLKKLDRGIQELYCKLNNQKSEKELVDNLMQSIIENSQDKQMLDGLQSTHDVQQYIKEHFPWLILKQDVVKGRFLAAKQDIPPATDVVQEMPISAIIKKQQRKQKCWWCFGEIGKYKNHPCLNCCMAFYCSPKCRQNDFVAHRRMNPLECGTPFCALLDQPTILAIRLAILELQNSQNKDLQIIPLLQDHVQNMQYEILRVQTIRSTLAAKSIQYFLNKNIAQQTNNQFQGHNFNENVLLDGNVDNSSENQDDNFQQFYLEEHKKISSNIQNEQSDQIEQMQFGDNKNEKSELQDRNVQYQQIQEGKDTSNEKEDYTDNIVQQLQQSGKDKVIGRDNFDEKSNSVDTSQIQDFYRVKQLQATTKSSNQESTLNFFQQKVYQNCDSIHLQNLNSMIQNSSCSFTWKVLQILLRIEINGIAVTPKRLSSSDDRIGLGLFPVSSFFNHSCCPNVQLRFEGRKLIGRVVKRVQKGQELVISYGPQIGAENTESRRRQLKEQYHFHCTCDGCQDKEVQLVEEMNKSFLCRREGCNGLINISQLKPCNSCGAYLDNDQITEIEQQYWFSKELEERANILIEQKPNDQQQIYDLYKRSYQIKSAILYPALNNEIGGCAIQLRDICRELGRYEEAVELGKKIVEIVEHNYGKNTPQVAFEKKELFDLMMKVEEYSEEALELQKEVEDILFLNFGSQVD